MGSKFFDVADFLTERMPEWMFGFIAKTFRPLYNGGRALSAWLDRVTSKSSENARFAGAVAGLVGTFATTVTGVILCITGVALALVGSLPGFIAAVGGGAIWGFALGLMDGTGGKPSYDAAALAEKKAARVEARAKKADIKEMKAQIKAGKAFIDASIDTILRIQSGKLQESCPDGSDDLKELLAISDGLRNNSLNDEKLKEAFDKVKALCNKAKENTTLATVEAAKKLVELNGNKAV